MLLWKTIEGLGFRLGLGLSYFILNSPQLTRAVTCSRLYLGGTIWGVNVRWTTSKTQIEKNDLMGCLIITSNESNVTKIQKTYLVAFFNINLLNEENILVNWDNICLYNQSEPSFCLSSFLLNLYQSQQNNKPN